MFENTRIRLRAPEPEDLEFLYRLENDVDLWKYGATVNPLSRFALKEYIAHSSDNIFDTKQMRLMIDCSPTGETIGAVDLFDFDPFHQRASAGIVIDRPFQQKGYASDAIELLIKYAFEWLRLHQLYAHVPVQNSPSLRLFRKNGFTEAGLLKEWIRWNNDFEDVVLLQLIHHES